MSKKIHHTTLARIAERTLISIGRFCNDEAHCCLSRHFRIIQQHAASHSR
jgi:hypothetical protein